MHSKEERQGEKKKTRKNTKKHKKPTKHKVRKSTTAGVSLKLDIKRFIRPPWPSGDDNT